MSRELPKHRAHQLSSQPTSKQPVVSHLQKPCRTQAALLDPKQLYPPDKAAIQWPGRWLPPGLAENSCGAHTVGGQEQRGKRKDNGETPIMWITEAEAYLKTAYQHQHWKYPSSWIHHCTTSSASEVARKVNKTTTIKITCNAPAMI